MTTPWGTRWLVVGIAVAVIGATAVASTGGVAAQMAGDVDRHYIGMMIPHLDDAIVMAVFALAQAERPEIRQLALTIKWTQAVEIEQMRA